MTSLAGEPGGGKCANQQRQVLFPRQPARISEQHAVVGDTPRPPQGHIPSRPKPVHVDPIGDPVHLFRPRLYSPVASFRSVFEGTITPKKRVQESLRSQTRRRFRPFDSSGPKPSSVCNTGQMDESAPAITASNAPQL